jgi:PAS domain S-box-containing protein
MKRFSTNWILATGIASVIITVATVLFVSIRQSQRVRDTTIQLDRTEQVLKQIQKLIVTSLDNETGARGFVITGRERYLEPLRNSAEAFRADITNLEKLVAGNSLQLQLLDSLKTSVSRRVIFSDSMVLLRRQTGLEATIDLVETGRGKHHTDEIRRIGNKMSHIASQLLTERKAKNEKTITNLNIILYSILAVVALMSFYIIRRIKKDIDRQRANEEKFSALLDAAPDATVIVDSSGTIQMINLQAENLFGYTRDEMLGQQVEILIPGELKIKHVQHRHNFMKAAKVRAMGAGIELNAVKKDGVMFPVEISLSPINTKAGVLVSASVRDITLRKNLENELKKMNSELEAFTYSVSHDLRAPLRGIIGFTAILEEDYSSKLDDEARRITGIIKANTLKMGHLVDDLLAFSRTGRQELLKTTVSMTGIVIEIINEIKAGGSNHRIEWNTGALADVNADVSTIRQVWINLISNAVKYSGNQEKPRIDIGYNRQQDRYVFYVKDNGVGFDNRYRDKLFRVFQRLHSAEEFEGTGVGLALVEKIISRHGGSVWAEGEVGKGASFYFSLPAD